MNLKKAKRLRRIVHMMTVGKPWTQYIVVKRPWGAPPAPIKLSKDCGRYHYQRTKKLWKRSKHA